MQQAFYAPQARAVLAGGAAHPDVRGTVAFSPAPGGVLVVVDVAGLPVAQTPCAANVFALHLHSGATCGGTAFSDTLGHYNPADCPHPAHAGDFPPLLAGKSGRAFCAFLTDRLTWTEVLGKTVVLHSGRDDFTTQPAGDAGEKIACGVVTAP